MPPMPPQLKDELQAKPVEIWDRFVGHPASGIDPRRVVSIYRNAEGGYPLEQSDFFADIVENDGHLRSAIEDRLLAVAGKDWQVMPGGEKPIDIKAADLLQAMLEESNFDDAIAGILSSRYYGYSGSEIDWKRLDGEIVPSHFVTMPFRRFRFDSKDQPLLLNSSDYQGEPLAPGSWIWTANINALCHITPRSGMLRTAAWFALFKRWSWRDWVIYAEKFGIPLVIGKHDPNASEDEKSQLESTVQDIGEAGQATMSTNTEIDIREAQRSGDSASLHRSIVAEANQEIAKLITGSTLTGQTGGPGSFALGKVHEGRAFSLVQADARMVSRRFSKDLAAPFLEFNGLSGARLPWLKIYVERETDPTRRLDMAKKAQDMGLPLDIEQIRAETGFRAPPNEARELKAPTPPDGPEEPTDDQAPDDEIE
jgi:phage gp29-like protein